MASKPVFRSLPTQLSLVIGVVLITVAVCEQIWEIAFAGTCCIVVWGYFSYHRLSLLKEQCWLILEAVKNADYSFRLSAQNPTYEQEVLQDTLNRFGQLMSEQKQWMEQRERFYGQILANMSLGIIVLDENGLVIQANPEAARLLDLVSIESLQQLSVIGKEWPETLAKLEPGEKCIIPVPKPTGELQLSVKASTMTQGQRRIRILTLNDIRNELDTKELESWIRLTRVLTHEIMNAIAPISSLSQTFLKKEDIIHSPYYEGMRAIHQTSKGLIAFVDSYRKFSSLQKPSPKPFYLSEVLQQINDLQCIPPQIHFTTHILPEDLMLYADPNLIQQVFINLIKNAVQAYDGEAGEILVEAQTTANEHILIHVRNNAPAIPPEVADQLFVPFFTTKKEGSGIGLSISRQIMKLSGGTISLLKKPEKNWNTTFVLEFE